MAAKLTTNQRRFLADAVKGAGGMAIQSITHPSFTALEKRGLVAWRIEPAKAGGGQWIPTDAGRTALAST
jgi:hypothetical protein